MDDKVCLKLLNDNDEDYKLLYKWYHNKKVYTYFEQRILTYNEIVDKYSKRTSLDSITPVYMILYNNKPVGIIQYTRLSNESKRRLHISDDGYEIDIFIGEEGYYHMGIGSRAIEMLIKNLDDNKIFVMVSEIDNINAIKCYQKVGFVKTVIISEEDTIGVMKQKVVMFYKK